MSAPKLTEAQRKMLVTIDTTGSTGTRSPHARKTFYALANKGLVVRGAEFPIKLTDAGRFALYVALHCNDIPQCCASHGSCRCLCGRCSSAGRFPLRGGS